MLKLKSFLNILVYFRQASTSSNNYQIKFGVENLNLCNLQSLSVMDMKIFLYMTSFQAISFLKSQNNITNSSFLLPFLLISSNLCNQRQQEWWSHSYDILFKSEEDRLKNSIDVKKQNNMVKILELVRLKSSIVKLSLDIASSKHVEKYKYNVKICVKLVKYLEYLVDNLKCNQKINSDKVNAPFFYAESFCTPKEKLNYFKRYKYIYWNFVCKQLIKLRQLALVNDPTIDKLELSLVLGANTSISSTVLESPERTFKHEDKTQLEIKNFFDFHEQLRDLDSNKENFKVDEDISRKFSNDAFDFDATILDGLLSLILNQVQMGACDEHEYDSDLNELEMIERVHVSSLSNLNEAISFVNLVDSGKDLNSSLTESLKLNHFQLQVRNVLVLKIFSCLWKN